MCVPAEAVRQMKTDEIMMSRVVITFLPLNGSRGRMGTEEEASCDIITHSPPIYSHTL